MQEQCKDFQAYDEDSLLELEEGAEVDADEDSAPKTKKDKTVKRIKSSYKAHYGKTKSAIDKENNHILGTQATCLRFVKKYKGMPKVCSWCKHAKAPEIRWKWVTDEKVWYRWYDNKWHYWGPSKSGFTAAGWTWYKGYWHHGGYVYKFVHGKWYRFQGGKWVFYRKRVPLNPQAPRERPICRPFYKLMKYGFPASLAAAKMPRCKVGSGTHAAIFMWKDQKACRFLGGKLTYQKKQTCKIGKPHQWKRVVRCVKGAVISHKGLDYHTGKGHVKANANVKSLGMRRILLEDEHSQSVGFPGKQVGAAAVLEAGPMGQKNDKFTLGKILKGKFKGMYIFQTGGAFKELIGAMGGVDRLGGWLTHEKPKMKAYQVWKLEQTTEETTISDPAGKWCLTRFTENDSTVVQLPDNTKDTETKADHGLHIKYSKDVKLAPCKGLATQYWYLSKK